MSIEFSENSPFVVEFKDIKINSASLFEDVTLNLKTPVISDVDLNERLNNLKELMRG